ncbi:MAG: 3-hydroxyacyl-CoA dehydrogenase family protein [Polyangiales bacterium]
MSETKGFERVAVIGAGTMGSGIAQVCAQSGLAVSVCDTSEASLARGRKTVESSLERIVAKGRLTAEARDEALARIAWGATLEAAVGEADAVIEAVPERMELKVDTFRRVDAAAPEGALLGSNTSSLSITEIAQGLKNPARLVGMHFFNPVPVMELLELVRGVRTADETVARAQSLSARLGKTSIVVRDVPGFATSRLGVILGAEAIRMLESGVATAEDIDRAMELGYRHPMGPLRLTDLVGLDVRLAILDHLHKELGEQFRAPALLRQMVRAGKLGKKTGEGFYKW